VSVTLTAGGTTTFAAQALNKYGAGQFSGFGNSTSIFTGQELYAWGYNIDGQHGVGDTVNRSSPVQVGAETDWAQFSTRATTVAAVTTNGEMYVWGKNDTGSLGLNDSFNRSSPVQLGALTNWAQASAGGFVTAAIKTDGTLWTWGNDSSGRLGLNQPDTDRSSPVQVGSLTDWAQVSAGGFCAAVKTDGTLWVWGGASNGQLGNNLSGPNIEQSSPVQVGALTNWAKVVHEGNWVAAIKTDGTLWAWGQNTSDGVLGLNDLISRSSPVQVGALTNWAKIIDQAPSNVIGAIKTDGTLWTWGDGRNGRLGDNAAIDRSSPVQIGSGTNWSEISTGGAGMAITTNGELYSWGSSLFGGHGQNDAIDKSSPVQVGSLTSWSKVSNGTAFSVAAIGTTS